VSGHDPIELLRNLARAQRASFESTADADQLLARLGAPKRGRFRAWLRRRRRWLAGIVAVVVGAGGGTVAWAIIRTERATAPSLIGCHRTADVDGDVLVIDTDGNDPAARCVDAWPRLMPDWGAPPTMVACRGDNGAPAVFPGLESICMELGLPLLDSSLTTDQERFLAFREAFTSQIGVRGCMPPDQVRDLALEYLERFEVEGWTVRIEGHYYPDQPCGGPGFDEVARLISILPLPDRFDEDEGD
jgi:hypothetical protein